MRKINIGEIFWFIILLGFSVYLNFLLYSGEISNYIHPHMIKYTKLAMVVFIVLAVVQVRRIFFVKKSRVSLSVSIFLVPLLLGSILVGEGNEVDILSNKSIEYDLQISDHTHEHYNNEDAHEFLEVYNELQTNLDKNINKDIELSGFVFKDKTLNESQFYLSRLIMACCAADSQMIGFLCDSNDNNFKLKSKVWVKIKGRIESKKIIQNGKEKIVPVIKIIRVQHIDKPDNTYIYP